MEKIKHQSKKNSIAKYMYNTYFSCPIHVSLIFIDKKYQIWIPEIEYYQTSNLTTGSFEIAK